MAFRYSAAGFRSDAQQLYTLFSTPIPEEDGQTPKEISLRFTRFCEFWKDMNFSLVFRLRQNENDLREFVDETYLEVLPFVATEYPFARRVCALYMLYALYVKQPKICQKIRINFQYLEQIRELIERCKELEQLDVCFVWYKLLSLGAIDLVHVSRLMGPYYMRNLRVSNERLTETDSIIDNFNTSIYSPLNELSDIHEKYRQMKDNLVEKSPQFSKECDKVVDNIFELFKTKGDNLHKQFLSNNLSQQSITSEFDSQDSNDSDDRQKSYDIGSKRRRLKEKASGFGNTVRQQIIEEVSQKQKKKPKAPRGRPKLAKLTHIQ